LKELLLQLNVILELTLLLQLLLLLLKLNLLDLLKWQILRECWVREWHICDRGKIKLGIRHLLLQNRLS